MNFYVDSGGVVLHVDPERVFQGQANASKIRFVGAFAASMPVLVAFKLPNGVWTNPVEMGLSAQLSGVHDSNGVEFNVWERTLPEVVTEYYGTVNVQFFVYGNAGEGSGARIASALSSFEVEKGVPIILPEATDEYETLLTQILSALEQLQQSDSEGALAAQKAAAAAELSAEKAAQSETNTLNSENRVNQLAAVTQGYLNLTIKYAVSDEPFTIDGVEYYSAKYYAGSADISAGLAEDSAANAKRSEINASQSAEAAEDSAASAAASANTAKTNADDTEGYLLTVGQIANEVTADKNQAKSYAESAALSQTIAVESANDAMLYAERAEYAAEQTAGIYRYKGTVQFYDELIGIQEEAINSDDPESILKNGDVYNVDEPYGDFGAGTNFAFNLNDYETYEYGKWDALGGSFHVDMSMIGKTGRLADAISDSTHRTVSDTEKSTWNGKQDALTFDSTPTEGSANPVTSGGIYTALQNVTVDLSEYATKEELTETNAAINQTKTELERVQQDIATLYAIGEQAGTFYVQPVEDTYTVRETAGGLNIVDGVETTVQRIAGSTVKTTNLFDGELITGFYSDDLYSITNNTVYRSLKMYLPAGTYSLQCSVSINVVRTIFDDVYSVVSVAGTIYNFTVTQNGYVGISFRQTSSSTDDWNDNNQVWITRGDTATVYTPYFAGLKHASFKGIASTGRNLFNTNRTEQTLGGNRLEQRPGIIAPDGIFIGATSNDYQTVANCQNVQYDTNTGSITWEQSNVNTSGYGIGFNFKVQPNTAYTISGTLNNSSLRIGYYDSQARWIGANTTGTSRIVFTSPENCYYILMIIVGDNPGTGLTYAASNLQFNMGNENLPYEPYIADDSFSLSESVELPEWDYIDPQTGKKVVQTNTIVFDGTENWALYSNTSGAHIFIYALEVTRLRALQTEVVCSNNISDKVAFTGYSNGSYGTVQVVFLNDSEGNALFNTVAEFKAYLAELYAAGNPLTVAYKLAASVETDISIPTGYTAYKNGSERINQGENDNSEYGAEVTVSQEYYALPEEETT